MSTAPFLPASPVIATRYGHRLGRAEYRAYPWGLSHVDGGSGAWYGDESTARTVLAAVVGDGLATAAPVTPWGSWLNR